MSILNRLKSTTDIDIGLDLPSAEMLPGSSFGATIVLTSAETSAIRGGYAALLLRESVQYKYEYRDDDDWRTRADTHTVEQVQRQVELLGATTLTAGETCRFSVSFALPANAAPTLHGKLIQRQWLLKVWLDRANAIDDSASAEIHVVQPAAVPGQTMTVSEWYADIGELTVHLQGDRWQMGDTVRGELILAPEQAWQKGTISAELGWREHVWRRLPSSDRPPSHIHRFVDHTHDGDAEQLVLAEDVAISAEVPLHLPFALTLPTTALPSASATSYRLDWRLTVTLRRPFQWRSPLAKRSFPVEVELAVGGNGLLPTA